MPASCAKIKLRPAFNYHNYYKDKAMDNQAYQDSVTMKRVGLVVAALVGVAAGLIVAVLIIT